MDQLIFASLSHTHFWYEVGMLKVPAVRVFFKQLHSIQLTLILLLLLLLSDGVGRLNLPVNQDKHRADKFSQMVRTAIKQTFVMMIG